MTEYENISPLHERRPVWINQLIDIHEKQSQNDGRRYEYQGKTSECRFKTEKSRSVSAVELIGSRENLRILDIGAARGAFVLMAQEMGHTAQALSIYDYHTNEYPMTNRILEQNYIVGNAERLSNVKGLLGGYDLVISNKTFWLLIDPLGTLEQAYDKILPGGTIAVENFPLGKGVKPAGRDTSQLDIDTIGDLTVQAGFAEVSISSSQDVGHGANFVDIVATRTSSRLAKTAFSMEYQMNGNSWQYAPVKKNC